MNERLLKLAEFADSPEITQMESILDILEEVQKTNESLTKKIEDSVESIVSSRMDYNEKLDIIHEKMCEEKPIEEEKDEEITVTLTIV